MKKIKYIQQINDNTFRIRFRISKNPDGSDNYFTKQLSNITLDEAKSFCDEQRDKLIKRKDEIKNYNMTMNEYAKKWFEEEVKINQSPTTYTDKYSKYKNYIAPYIGKEKLNEITKEMAKSYLIVLRSIEGVSGKKHLCENTISHIIRCASALMEYAISEGDTINVNHFRNLPLKKEEKEDVVAYNSKEKQEILTQLKNESTIFKLIVLTGLFTGLRRGELSSLKFSSIKEDINGKHYLVVEEATTQTKIFGLTAKKPKSGKSRDVPLPESLYKYFMEYAKWQRDKHSNDAGKEFTINWSQNNYIFMEEDFNNLSLKRITPNVISKRWDKFKNKNFDKFPSYKFHSLRATYASDLIHSRKFTTLDIQHFLGHESYATTLRWYAALDKQSVARASAILDEDLNNLIGGVL